VILKRIEKLAEQRNALIGDFFVHVCEKTVMPLLYLGVLYFSIHHLTLHALVLKGVYVVGVVILTFLSIRFVVRVVEHSLQVWQGQRTSLLASQGILTLLKVIIWGLGIIFLLDNLGFKVSAIIAGLGIGGIAAALAAQAILGDLFNYFVILLDRPFEVGDFIVVGDCMGTVEYTGIKTTRIRSLDGEELIFPNTDLTNARLRNYKRMERRRAAFKIGITYQTKLPQLKEIPDFIANIVRNLKDVELDRVHFASYGDFSIVFEVVYYVLSRDYKKYMDIQQEINLAIKEEFEKRGIEFAYPTHMVYVK
jgi:small-conductance mechanosensitive channel